MIVPGSVNPLLLATGGYEIPYSLRFRAANSAYLERTPASASNRKTWTWSAWVKRGTLGGAVSMNIFVGNRAGTTDATYTDIVFTPSNQFAFRGYSTNWRITTAVFRDTSAWYHLVVALDTTQATADDRVKIYVNGTQITAFGTSNNPALNADLGVNTAQPQSIGRDVSGGGTFFDGYMSEINFIDGQQLSPSSFGQTDSATGVWVPKKYSGTYGTNGFYLKFADASAATATAIGKDSSGNGNNWTPSGISVTSGVTFDQMLDTPTLNYCVLNPLNSMDATYINSANLKINATAGTYAYLFASTISVSSGKWYFEATCGDAQIGQDMIGILRDTFNLNGSTDGGYSNASFYGYIKNGQKTNGTTQSAYGSSWTIGDIVACAYDAGAGTLSFYKNGVSQGNAFTGLSGGFVFAICSYSSGVMDVNFGQRAFSYTPPSGFKALNTANLPTPSIKKGSLYMDATLRTGTGATASVSSLGFQPDLVWIKSRSAATDHGLYDAVRGVQKQLESNTATAETTETTGLTAFNSNGYTVGALAQLNTSAATYVDWAWKEGVTPGFDIVTYVGNGTNRTISHNLGAVPKLIILRSREATSTGRWTVQHGYYGSARYAYLNETFAFDTANANLRWNSTDPTSSVFSIGTSSDVNHTSDNYVGYLWSEIEGFSKFGSYTGNGSTDGPFVFCGFQPRWLLVKRTSSIGSWYLIDTARNPYNATSVSLLAENSVSEGSISNPAIDIVSNGMKIRNTIADFNSSGGTFIFAAFAENPFKYARAR